MLIGLIIIGVAVLACVVWPEAEPQAVVEHHHHHRTVIIERPAAVQAQITLIKMEIALIEARLEPAPPRLPEARALVSTKKALERYRS